MAEIENLKIGNGGTLHIVGNEDIVANAWQAGKTYVKNKSYVIQEHRLYVCNVTHTSVEPFDATKWTEITIGDAIGNNIGDLTTLSTSNKSSLVGAVNEVDGKATSGAVTISPASGYSIIGHSNFINDKSVGLNFYMEKTGGWTTGWLVVGTVDKKPSGNVYCPLWNVTNGGANGMCRIDTDGTINFYVTTAGNVRLNANITYRTA